MADNGGMCGSFSSVSGSYGREGRDFMGSKWAYFGPLPSSLYDMNSWTQYNAPLVIIIPY